MYGAEEWAPTRSMRRASLLMSGLLFTPAPAEQGAGAKLPGDSCVLEGHRQGSQAVHAGGPLKSLNPVLPFYGWET